MVHFISPSFRFSWLKAKKEKSELKCSEIDGGQFENLIFINQRRTRQERLALKDARKAIADSDFH